jgi:hypothetical protein
MEKSTQRNFVILGIVALISTTSYILASKLYYRIGYPLDDAWIYQTYARNLSQLGEWSFIPGSESGGSTGPFWVVLIAIGYYMSLDHLFWAYLLGSINLVGVGILGMLGFKLLQPDWKKWSLYAGLTFVLEWHLIWAAVSGMETMLFAFIILLTLVWLLRPKIRPTEWFFLGILIGMSVWIRPDGISLLGPAGLVIITQKNTPSQRKLKNMLHFLLGILLPVIWYFVFNHITSGSLWPNTFYAKQAEYAELRESPLLLRLYRQFVVLLPGIASILLPGFILSIIQAVKLKKWALLSSAIWTIGYISLYAIRLPVIYQHGRYILPALPVFILIGAAGSIPWILSRLEDQKMVWRIISKVWLISGISILFLFWILGAKTYAEDVAIIESEMVETAKWIQEKTDTEALIAAHDIGALGYFGQREIVDLAGLITPDVIPFIRDERSIANYLDSKNVDYLMTFPAWYPSLTSRSTIIYITNNPYSPAAGGENMAFYQWRSSK